MELKLKNKKITKIGGSKGFIIDAAYFKNKQIFEDQLYDLIIIPTSSKLSFESPNTLSEKHNSGGANPIIHLSINVLCTEENHQVRKRYTFS